jgi:hypothetical protein
MKSSDIEIKERKALAASTTTMSYHTRALAELQLEQGQSGRFTDKAVVNGSKPTVGVPRQPEGSPWAGDLVPPEPPLGYEINSQEPCGEPFELAASFALSPEDTALATEVGHSASGAAPDCASPWLQSGASQNVIEDLPDGTCRDGLVGRDDAEASASGGVGASTSFRRGRKL